MLFIERPDFVWGLIASMYLGNIVAVLVVLTTIPIFASILRIPFAIIGPVIVVVCFIGAYTVAGRPFDLWLALAFGVAGYVFKKLDYPIAPLVLAMVLGDKAEDAFQAINDHVERFALRSSGRTALSARLSPSACCWLCGLFSRAPRLVCCEQSHRPRPLDGTDRSWVARSRNQTVVAPGYDSQGGLGDDIR